MKRCAWAHIVACRGGGTIAVGIDRYRTTEGRGVNITPAPPTAFNPLHLERMEGLVLRINLGSLHCCHPPMTT
ncbi:MAG: hypothetical protein AAFS10_08345, partial [Myxococcota bacterium]